MKLLFSIFSLCLWFGCSYSQVTSDSLVLYLPLNGNADDFSGNGNHGTSHFTVSDTNRLGQTDASMRFNGINSYISIPASPSMNLIQKSNKVTISAWIDIFRWHSSGNVFSVFERYNPATDAGWLFEANLVPGGFLFLANETNTNWSGCNTPTPFNEWLHVAVTYDKSGGRVKFYVNGQKVCDKLYSQNINVGDTTSSFAVGRSLAGPDEYSDGLIDDLKVYCRALNDNEIVVISSTKPTHQNQKNGNHLKFSLQPGTPKWNVTFEEDQIPDQLKIFSVTGRQVYHQTILPSTKSVLLPDLPAGLYIVAAPGYTSGKWLVNR